MKKDTYNELIARFMGLKPKNKMHGSYIWSNYDNIPELAEIIMKEIGEEQWYICTRFDESWDWLMPVIQKINKKTQNVPGMILTLSNIHKYTCNVMIDKTFDSVVEWIKIYNVD